MIFNKELFIKQNRNIILVILLLSNFVIASENLKRLDKECEKGNAKICLDLSSYYANGSMFLNIKKNDVKAKKYYEKYYKLANTDNITLLSKQCDDGLVESCRYIAYAYRDGKHVRKNKNREIEYYKKACRLGDVYICKKIPISNNMPEYFSAAIRLTNRNQRYSMLRKACDGEYAKACNYLFQAYADDGKKKESSKYFLRTKKLMEKYCNQNNAASCQWMWNFYIKNKKRAEGKVYFHKAKELYKKECDSNHSSCLEYQLLLKNGY